MKSSDEGSGRWNVLKFGGTSVSSRATWDTIAEVASQHLGEGARPLIVCSAVSGISNKIEALGEAALKGEHEPVFEEIEARHVALGEELEVGAAELLAEPLEELRRLATGASLTGELSPRLKARMMATGELMSTRLGAAYLRQEHGLSVAWRDARQMLQAVEDAGSASNPQRHFLASACGYDFDEGLRGELDASDEDVVLSQGFIARDAAGETVLLGRGGSDTSAAYLAAKIGAERLEIWTDVPGMFTANPRQITSARLLRQLDYDEAQELATTGAKVLHPRCVDPVRRAQIPLHIRCTSDPQMAGTRVSAQGLGSGPQVKAISSKGNLTLIVMDTLGMWQQVGFLADVFGVFRSSGLSIDLVATSETNVTVSLDPIANALDRGTLERLLRDLKRYCHARVVAPAAAVSLVGRNIRAILHKLGPALEVFEEQQVYMVSQAASDLNLTFVVDEEQADRLVRKLHALLFAAAAMPVGPAAADEEGDDDQLFGPTWRELFGGEATRAGEQPERKPWWVRRKKRLLELAHEAGDVPRYVYDADTLHRQVDRLRKMKAVDRIFYAMKANPNAQILELFHDQGLGFECVSPGELDRVVGLFEGIDQSRLLFTPNFAPRADYEHAFRLGAAVTLDNLHPLEAWPELFRGQRVLVRLDPGVGRGHHKHVRTAGPQSKFGVAPSQLARLQALLQAADCQVMGLHAHVGSGIHDVETWQQTALFLSSFIDRFPTVEVLNLGGGLGVAERPGQTTLDTAAVSRSLAPLQKAHPGLELWIEPGRFLVAEAGVLLARVTQLKDKGQRRYVGVTAGMNSLIRPALYGAFHPIVNLSRLGEAATMTADVVGPICETGDVLGYSRQLPASTAEGDVLLISTAGAYGYAMSSQYNLREPADEVMLERKG